jgi:hypothetical protein
MVGFGNFSYCPKVIYPLYCCQSVVSFSRLLPIEICRTHIFILLVPTHRDRSRLFPNPTIPNSKKPEHL